jgi:hypothetical protein
LEVESKSVPPFFKKDSSGPRKAGVYFSPFPIPFLTQLLWTLARTEEEQSAKEETETKTWI